MSTRSVYMSCGGSALKMSVNGITHHDQDVKIATDEYALEGMDQNECKSGPRSA
jgi:hypothetical protein